MEMLYSIMFALMLALCATVMLGLFVMLFAMSPLLCIAALVLVIVFTLLDPASIRS